MNTKQIEECARDAGDVIDQMALEYVKLHGHDMASRQTLFLRHKLAEQQIQIDKLIAVCIYQQRALQYTGVGSIQEIVRANDLLSELSP